MDRYCLLFAAAAAMAMTTRAVVNVTRCGRPVVEATAHDHSTAAAAAAAVRRRRRRMMNLYISRSPTNRRFQRLVMVVMLLLLQLHLLLLMVLDLSLLLGLKLAAAAAAATVIERRA